jgi:hypothetical protein
MNPSHERLAARLREQAPSARPAPPADLCERILARIEDASAARARPRPWRLVAAAAALALFTAGVWLVRSPRSAEERPAEALASLPERTTFDRLVIASGVSGIQSLARSSQSLFTDELESPIRSELAALASDARHTADVLFAGLSRPVERLLSSRADR